MAPATGHFLSVSRHHQGRRMLLSFERPTGRIPAGAFSAVLENCTVIQQTGITDARVDHPQLPWRTGQLGLNGGTPPNVSASSNVEAGPLAGPLR